MFNFNKKKLVRLTLINNESLDYQLIKKSKKTLSLKISENGLVVSAPLFMSEIKINQIVISKIKWIKKKLELIEPQKNKLFIKNRASFDLLGKEIKITLLDGNNKIEWVDENNLKIFFKDQDDQKKLKTFFYKMVKGNSFGLFFSKSL